MSLSAVPSALAAGARGDVDGNSKINSNDALKVLQYSVGSSPKDFDKSVADMNSDGKINSADAVEILKICVGFVDPAPSSVEEIVSLYNSNLSNSYNQTATIENTTKVNLTVDSISGGDTVSAIANSVIKKYSEPQTETKSFTRGIAYDGEKASDYGLPTKLAASGVKSATMKKTSSGGYEISITLVSESSTISNPPVYNTQCSYPLDIASADLMGIKFTKANTVYTGTTINAVTDSQGRMTKVSLSMPIECSCSGKIGITIIDAELHGSWDIVETFKY